MPRKKVKVNDRLLKEALKSAIEQPRLAFYSPVASCIMNYWKSVVPRFSISEFLSEIVEKELSRRWPQLYKRAERALRAKLKSKRRRASRKP